jgi:hypothetical protein
VIGQTITLRLRAEHRKTGRRSRSKPEAKTVAAASSAFRFHTLFSLEERAAHALVRASYPDCLNIAVSESSARYVKGLSEKQFLQGHSRGNFGPGRSDETGSLDIVVRDDRSAASG